MPAIERFAVKARNAHLVGRCLVIDRRAFGDDEANIEKGKISFKAPIARALIGKQAGDVIEFKAPAGLMEYEIMAVRYC